jgi:hypothetical protein
VKVLFVSSAFGTPRHRCENPREALAKLGVEADTVMAENADLAQAAEGYSHVVLNRVPLTPAVGRLMRRSAARGNKVLFDVDDLLFEPDLLADLPFVKARTGEAQAMLLRVAGEIRDAMRACCAVTCATVRLAQEATRLRPAFVVCNCVSDELVELSRAVESAREGTDHPTLGFLAGHPGHVFNFAIVEQPLMEVLSRRPGWRLRLVGLAGEIGPRLGPLAERVELFPYVPWRDLPRLISQLDICLAPLVHDRFNDCKSDLRYLEAALCGVPVVASRWGEYRQTIVDGVNGALASNDEEWADKLETLMDDPSLRHSMAAADRNDVLSHRRIGVMGSQLLRALQDA